MARERVERFVRDVEHGMPNWYYRDKMDQGEGVLFWRRLQGRSGWISMPGGSLHAEEDLEMGLM